MNTKNVALYDLINNVAQSRKVGPPPCAQLMEYDKQNGSQLYETLCCLCEERLQRRDSEMFLHSATRYLTARLSEDSGSNRSLDWTISNAVHAEII